MKLVPVLQSLASNIDFNALPHKWKIRNISYFSQRKRLYDYQVEALKNAVKCLFLFYQEFQDASNTDRQPTFSDGVVEFDQWMKRRRAKFYSLIAYSLESIAMGGALELLCFEKGKGAFEDLKEAHGSTVGEKGRKKVELIEPHNFANRMSFWMATGSGKTLVLIKLIEILDSLLSAGVIPTNNLKNEPQCNNILVLSHREDLLRQLEQHVREFNEGRSRPIRLWNLKEYEEIQFLHSGISWNNAINVFVYRSDLISDETKENRLSFRDIEANGSWFVFLDEAHKGTKEDSKRQHYYSLLSRNGFLFNFSATFVDPWDIISTVYNFNLREFISRGYGKNILLPHTDFVKFSRKELSSDFSKEKKQRIILESLILLGLLIKTREGIIKGKVDQFGELYHKPLLVVYGKEVNTNQADVKLFFEHLSNIFRGRIGRAMFSEAKKSLIQLFSKRENREFVFGTGYLHINEEEIESYTFEELMKHIFHANTPSEAEIIQNPWNSKELGIKLKTADRPFALLKIGDISTWLRTNLSGYELFDVFEERSYFEELDKPESPFTILMGSQAFYEGWDSNRPNVILFINIGVRNAQKFVIQAVGRGVRINPFKGHRKRLEPLARENDEARILRRRLNKQMVSMIETLFLFGSSRENLAKILDSIEHVNTLILKEIPSVLETREVITPKGKETQELSGSIQKLSLKSLYDEELRNFVAWLGKTREERILKIAILLQSRFGNTCIVKVCEIEKILDMLESSETSEFKEIRDPLQKLILAYEVMFGEGVSSKA